MSRPLSKDEVQKRLDENFSRRVTLVGEYKNKRTPITIQCMECNRTWEMLPTTAMYSRGYQHKCPHCDGKKTGCTFQCANCGKKVYRSKSRIEKNETGLWYCSIHCGNEHKNKMNRENGKWDNSRSYRVRALEKYGARCETCGWDEDARVLEIHHIDENRDNNEIGNLIVLCPICHKKLTLHIAKLSNRKMLSNDNSEPTYEESAVLRVLGDAIEASNKEIAERTGFSTSKTRKLLYKLIDAGRVTTKVEGKHKYMLS